jgi:hypothetical protein
LLNITIGKRDQLTTDVFIEGLRHATASTPFQISTDGIAAYRFAIPTTLHDRISGSAQLIKVYRAPQDGEKRYSPAEVSSVEGSQFTASPILSVSALRKKWENHAAMVMPLVRLLQLLPDSQEPPRDACDGSGHYGSRLGIVVTVGLNAKVINSESRWQMRNDFWNTATCHVPSLGNGVGTILTELA